MSRKQLDVLFSGGAIVLAILMLVLGYVLGDQAAFADDYVKEQLSEQKIKFATQEELDKDEAAEANQKFAKVTEWKEGSKCLEENAGKDLTTGKQAECYGNFYIGMHMARSAANAGFEGATYATLGATRTELSAEVAAAKAKNDTAAADAAQKKLDSATSLRSTMQTGETLRGLLLTSYGFSIFGDKAALAATVCYLGAALLVILGIAGFVHAFVWSKNGRAA